MKKNDASFMNMDLIDLSALKEAVHLDNELILIDNMNFQQVDTACAAFFTNYPVKLSFSVIILLLSGSMKFHINLEYYEASSQDIIAVQKGAIGEFLYTDPNSRIAVIAFGNEYFRMTTHPEAAMKLQQITYKHPVNHCSDLVFKETLTIYQLMKRKITEIDNPFRKDTLQGYIQALMYNTSSYFLSLSQSYETGLNDSRQHEIYMRFIHEVQKHYTKERSVGFYAGLLCITPKYLSQTVRKASGRLAGEWITEYVILEAKALIKSRKYTIQQISEKLNFPNQSFFGRYFKKKVGCTPKDYQKT